MKKQKSWKNTVLKYLLVINLNLNFGKLFFSKIGPIDILIDDGGHSNLDQIITTVNVVEKIKDGGVIVIEDTHSSYLKKFSNPSKYSFISFSKIG